MGRRVVAAAGLTVLAVIMGAPVAGGSGGGGCPPPITNGTDTQAVIKNFCYEPTAIHIRPGSTVTWVNKDFAAHTVTGANRAWGSYKNLKARRSVSYQFNRAGVYPYYCVLHVGMVGAVVVRDGRLPEPLDRKEASQAVEKVRLENATPASAEAAAREEPEEGNVWPPIAGSALLIGALGLWARRPRPNR